MRKKNPFMESTKLARKEEERGKASSDGQYDTI